MSTPDPADLITRLRAQARSSEEGILDENGCARSDLSAAEALREAADYIEQSATRTIDVFDPLTGTWTPKTVPTSERYIPRERIQSDRLVIERAEYERLRAGSASFRDGVLALYETIRTQVPSEAGTLLARWVGRLADAQHAALEPEFVAASLTSAGFRAGVEALEEALAPQIGSSADSFALTREAARLVSASARGEARLPIGGSRTRSAAASTA